jgi:hypothetical protein
MAHIQRGDDRQYFSKGIAEQDMSGQYADMFDNALNTGVSITQKANESTLANNQIDLSTRFLAENNKINTKYQADPTNPQREIELQQAFESLANQYKINPTCQKQWSDIKNNVYNRYKTYNEQWVEKQQQSNISTNLKDGYENLTNQISMLGMNGASIDEVRLIYANGIEGLRNGAIAGLGEVTVNEFLKDSNHDIMTTYISSLALNNPLEAQRLLKDEGVRNDIGRAETLQKLDEYVANSLNNQAKRTAVNELGNTLRSMNSEDADNIINGKANLNQVMKFIESNKGLPEGSKDLILNIYGIGSKSEYYYDKDKKKIVKQEEKRGRGAANGLVALKNLSKTQKEELALDLEQRLYDMFTFEQPAKVNPKKAIKKGEAQGHQSNTLSMLESVAQAQGAIDTAWNAGVITKAQRQNMMNKFIEPMTNYLEANMQELDERSGFLGSKLGYDKLKKEFAIDKIPANHTREIKAKQKELLTAQGFYYKALDEARIKKHKDSIYGLEELTPEEQREIYQTASKYAIEQTQRISEQPEAFFKEEYPELYASGVALFGIKDGNKIARIVAKEIYNAPEGEKPDVKKVMSKAVNDVYSVKRDKAMMTKIQMYEKYHVSEKPKPPSMQVMRGGVPYKSKDYDEQMKVYNQRLKEYNLRQQRRMKNLGVSEADVKETAQKSGLTESQVLSALEIQQFKTKTGKDFSFANYY